MNQEITKIKKEKYKLFTKNKTYFFDIIIDATYEQSNSLIKNLDKIDKKKFQLVVVFEFISKNFDKMGLAVMDGNFFSFYQRVTKRDIYFTMLSTQ